MTKTTSTSTSFDMTKTKGIAVPEDQTEPSLSPFVVPCRDIPSCRGLEGLELKPFASHELLSGALPDSLVSMVWVSARPEQDIGLRSHADPSLLIVLKGAAELVGSTRKHIEGGDVVTLPRGHEYGFREVGSAGLQALQVSFKAAGTSNKTEDILSLEQLLRRNEERARETLDNPYFRMLRTGALSSDEARGRFRDYARVFCDAFQTFLFTRQATCRDEVYRATFGEHLREELGHNELMKLTGNPRRFDAVLEATSSWFSQQMLVLDNAGKAVVHLVLETGGDYFHNLAKPVFAADASAQYFETHAEDDAHHKEMSMQLLQGHHPYTYRRLHKVLEDAWDMLDTLTRRIEQLVERDHTGREPAR